MAEEKKTSKKAESTKSDKPKKSKKNPFKSIASFFKSVKSEGKKVVWAKPKETFKNTIVVLIVCIIVGVAIFLVDTGLSQGMKAIKNLADKEPTTASDTVKEDTSEDDTDAQDTSKDNTDTTDEASSKDAE